MDGLSSAASGVAVVSVAVQMVESVKKLHEFWGSIEEAPEDVRIISMDLELLSSVLTRIAYEAQHAEPEALLAIALNGCWTRVETLTAFLHEIEPGFASSNLRIRRWTALKIVLKQRQLIKFQEALERMKTTIGLVLQILER